MNVELVCGSSTIQISVVENWDGSEVLRVKSLYDGETMEIVEKAVSEDWPVTSINVLEFSVPRPSASNVDECAKDEEELLCERGECGHYTCTEGGTLGYWSGADPRLPGNF